MPVMNGLDAATLIKDELPDTKILMVSQWDSAVMKRQAFRTGRKWLCNQS
jgi:YesN/AraC family two-component response regulator